MSTNVKHGVCETCGREDILGYAGRYAGFVCPACASVIYIGEGITSDTDVIRKHLQDQYGEGESSAHS